jgi:drug/metabolite transporter (DMT)-like permease
MMAAFLYLGAGAGISILSLFHRKQESSQTKLDHGDLPYIIGMVILDMAAVILLMNGVALSNAANVSLLSNFEIVATALLAYFVFHEKVSARMWAALALITLSSIILSFEGTSSFQFSTGSFLVLCASICWGLENNCTKMISSKNTYEIIMIKGLCSGTGSLIIALILGEKLPSFSAVILILLLGFISYGLSIFAYIRAQNIIGAAKTSAFYALAPFIGTFLSFLLLHEELASTYYIGLAVMAAGSALSVIDTLTYHHSHMHTHVIYHLHHGRLEKEVITHTHEHAHIGPGLAHQHFHQHTVS